MYAVFPVRKADPLLAKWIIRTRGHDLHATISLPAIWWDFPLRVNCSLGNFKGAQGSLCCQIPDSNRIGLHHAGFGEKVVKSQFRYIDNNAPMLCPWQNPHGWNRDI